MRILIIDDDLQSEEILDLFKLRLSMMPLAAVRDIDEKTRRELVDTELAKDGFELECAFDGDAALTHYRQQGPYDHVLTDLYHPGMNGVELARAIRRENPAQALAVFSAGVSLGIPDPRIEALWEMRIPAMDKLDTWGTLPQFIDDAITLNRERLGVGLTGTVQ